MIGLYSKLFKRVTTLLATLEFIISEQFLIKEVKAIKACVFVCKKMESSCGDLGSPWE